MRHQAMNDKLSEEDVLSVIPYSVNQYTVRRTFYVKSSAACMHKG